MIDIETSLDLLNTMQNSLTSSEAKGVICGARHQLESMLARTSPEMSSQELALPTKSLRVRAYRDRTQCSVTTAHAVANASFRRRDHD
jgi:hypothetical protein